MLKLWGAIPLKFDDAPFFIYIVIMALKRDRVNRVNGLVYLPIDGQKFYKGKRVELVHVMEDPIDCSVRDAMAMKEPKNGNAVGDAVFDAMKDVKTLPEVIGDSNDPNTEVVIGYCSGNSAYLLDTGGSTYTGKQVDDCCYSGEAPEDEE